NATPLSIEIYPALALTPTITGVITCATNDGEITVNAVGGSGTYTYSINSSASSIVLSGNVFSGVPSGSYIITIEDTLTKCTETATITLDAATPVDFSLTPTDVTCNGGSDGTITVNLPASNDNPIYTYEIVSGPTPGPVQNSNVFTGLKAGFYTIQVNSGRGCSEIKTIEVKEADLIVVSAPVVVEYNCTTGTNATNFASISINAVTGGSGTYTRYEFIKGGAVVQSGSKNIYTESDLSGGLYTINVYDNNGCVGTATATIKPFIRLDALHVVIDTAITCTNDETIKVSVSSTGGTPTNLEYTLEDFAGEVPTQVNATGIFTGLPIGNYKITVTNIDTGCSLQTVHYVNNPNTFDLTVDAVVDVTCFGDSDGSVNVTFIDRFPTPTNKAGSFSYTVVNALGVQVANGTTPNAGPITIQGLASGTYTISASLTGSPFCTVDKNFTITAPSAALTISETHTEITCVIGNNDGSIFATATGGWPGGYEFELSGATITTIPYSSNGLFVNLSEGTYTVSVRDSKGCIDTKIVVLTNPLPILVTASADITMLTCFGDNNATITVDLPTGGQGSNYLYTLNRISPVASSSGPQASRVFSGLGAGTYSITVTDGYNCSADSAIIVIQPATEIKASLVVKKTPTCDFDATLTLSATGGTGPYTYSSNSTFANSIAFTGSTTFAVTPGTYKYYVRDANGCVAVVTNDIKIDPVPTLELILTSTNPDINCFGDNNGVIIAKAQGGLGNYVYTLLDASSNPIPGIFPNTTGVFNELHAGIYHVKVVSGDCNTVSGQKEIKQPLLPLAVTSSVLDVSCFGGNNGIVEIYATGGTGVIKYAISPQLNQFFDTNVFENLAPGTYQIIVQDELGCYEILDITIKQPDALIVDLVPSSIVPEVCEGDNDGEFSIAIIGGTAPYSVSLGDYNGPYTTGTLTQTQFDFTGLKGGDHTVFVRDAEGCETEWNITFPESVKIEPVAVVEYLCDDNTPGNRVTVTVDDSITDLSELHYSLNGGPIQSSNVFENVVPGIGHFVEVTHTNGCEKTTALFDIVQVNALMLGLNDGGLNEIVAMATGGTGGYQFTLNGEDYGSTSSFIITKSGEYTVTVTDNSGCIATATRYFEFIDICIPNYFTPNGDNNQDTWAPGCAVNFPNMEFKIFDRYGREVGTYRLGQAWDGKYRERELPTGDYWYIIKLNNDKDNRDFVGHFTLYR
ncbi:MAG: T9SS type B sorting domain-containing protein, partial [Gelidibacter sp.]